MSLTIDPNNPYLNKTKDDDSGQNEVYLVLSEEERAKGFVRPLRDAYIHRGRKLDGVPVPLNQEEMYKWEKYGYIAFAPNPDIGSSMVGTYLTKNDIETYQDGYVGGCGAVTTMSSAIAETYARDPSYYGATFCVGCRKHHPVNEFVWKDTNETVGS